VVTKKEKEEEKQESEDDYEANISFQARHILCDFEG